MPLSQQAIEIARYLLGVMRPAQKYLLSHRSELKKRISENTLNKAVQLMGYEGRLTGHGIRGTISTALNEIGYPKIWVDAQLSHSDPNKVSSAYNHAKYVEPRRRMMQDWADRLDLLEQGEVEAASAHLTIRIDGVPAMAEVEEAVGTPPTVAEPAVPGVPPVVATPIVVTPNSGGITFQRLSQVPPPPTHAPEPEVSAIQREREEMLAIYESPNNLPVPLFGKLAGKSKDQINRELKAGKLLSISLGNRGQRVPDWQLVPLKHRLAQVLMNQYPHADSWDLYRMLTGRTRTWGIARPSMWSRQPTCPRSSGPSWGTIGTMRMCPRPLPRGRSQRMCVRACVGWWIAQWCLRGLDAWAAPYGRAAMASAIGCSSSRA